MDRFQVTQNYKDYFYEKTILTILFLATSNGFAAPGITCTLSAWKIGGGIQQYSATVPTSVDQTAATAVAEVVAQCNQATGWKPVASPVVKNNPNCVDISLGVSVRCMFQAY